METKNLYNSLNLADKIKDVAKFKSVALKDMLSDLELGSNTMSNMRHGRMLAADSLARIADYLDVSVDYLLGRTDVPEVNR
jgi:transcriptional regulator with XRE-family HTH domain